MAPLLVAWLYVWLWVEPPLRYHRSAPLFLLRTDFFAEHLKRPGGLLDYAAAWLAQLDCRAMLGALVITAMIGMVAGGAHVVFRRGARGHPAMSFVPAWLLLVLAGQYDFPVAATGLGVLLAVWGVAAWQVWRPDKAGLRCAALGVAGALLCYVAGPVPALLFAILSSVWEARTVRPASAAVCGLAALVGLGGLLVVPEISRAGLLPRWGQGVPLITCVILHVFLPLALWRSSKRPETHPATELESSRHARSPRAPPRPRGWRHGFGWQWRAVGLAAGVGVLALTFDSSRKAITRIEWDVQEGRWERALETARRLRAKPGPATRLAINRALFHGGRLTEDLFAFAQQKGDDLLPSLRDGMKVCAPLSDTLLELGQVNLAEHYAHEALETTGERPYLLWQLARINVLLDRPRAARVFLHRLRQVPFHRGRAERRLRALEADPTLATEPDIARVRPLRVTTDQAEGNLPTEFLLRQLLQSNRRNRMAFEYLLAHYLLTDQPEAVVQQVGALDQFGSWETPRHVEEAMLLHPAAKGDGQPEIGGRRVSADTVRRYREFENRLSQNGGRGTGIETQLAREFGDSYWFYHLFGATFGGAPPAFTTTRK